MFMGYLYFLYFFIISNEDYMVPLGRNKIISFHIPQLRLLLL